MIPYADFTYFGLLLYAAVPTLILGLFGKAGWRWAALVTAGMLLVQYQNIKGTDVSQFAGPGKRVVLLPETWKSGSLIYPYAEALK